jgi:hypothetical protein
MRHFDLQWTTKDRFVADRTRALGSKHHLLLKNMIEVFIFSWTGGVYQVELSLRLS